MTSCLLRNNCPRVCSVWSGSDCTVSSVVLYIALVAIQEVTELAISINGHIKEAKAKGRGACVGIAKGLKNYFTSFWNMVDLTLIIAASLLMSLQVRFYETTYDVKDRLAEAAKNSDGILDGPVLAAYTIRLGAQKDLLQIINTVCMLIVFLKYFTNL